MRRILTGLVLALLIAAPVAAAKPSSASCVAEPNPVPVSTYVTISAAGLNPGRLHAIGYEDRVGTAITITVYPNPDGTLAAQFFANWDGPARGFVREYRNSNVSFRDVASCPLTVQ